MSQPDDSAARSVPWYLDIVNGAGAARGLDKDLRDALVEATRDRATSEARWVAEGVDSGEQAPPSPPTVSDLQLDRRHVLRSSDVIVTWEGLTPPSTRATVIGPDGEEQIVPSGNSASVRVLVSGQVMLRLNNEGRITDLLAGEVECFELPAFRIPAGVLPPVPRIGLPRVQIPSRSVAALHVPVPRFTTESVAHVQRQTRDSAPRAVGAAARLMGLLRESLNGGDRSPRGEVRAALLRRQSDSSRL
ncbi:hypothetical protein [Agromyces allii]|uniref:Transcription regulator HTH AraC- type ligand binding domain-containing protein n=1 Tax=Agromyces allii TaxID=393607 RepID=A0ABP5CTF5_9MICO|nr:hypothetical protein [Agromyces allii]